MQLIVITRPGFFPEEAKYINALFDNGLATLHLRKPQADITEIRRLIEEIHPAYYPRIVLHDGFSLAGEYPLKGIHLNGRNPLVPTGFKGSVSRSCHSLEEVARWKERCDYVFLSPVYDSISKEGYKSGFTREDLLKASDEGIIDRKVVALGGITLSRLPELHALHFGGVAMLGGIWKSTGHKDFIPDFTKTKTLCDNLK